MCGRFACGLSPDVVRRLSTYMHSQTHELIEPPFIDLMRQTRSFRPSWNLAPTSTCLCLISAKHLDETEDSSTRVLCSMRWSLIPPYHKGSLAEFKLVLNNCRSETIDVKPSFKRPLKNGQRCVILAEGFFEWKKNVSKMPFFIYQSKPFLNEKDYPNIDVEKILPKIEINKPPLLAMAGLFDINRHCEIEPLYSCTICTVNASATMRDVHVRMPAILSNQQEIDEWLDFGRYNTEEVLPLLTSHNDIQMYRVTPNVGSTKVNDMNNIRPMNFDKENKTGSSNLNTLDSFVIKKAPKKYFEDIPLTDKTNKRNQTAIDDHPSKPPAKRLKK
jgi:putative SOS response-associated peptidase YedK